MNKPTNLLFITGAGASKSLIKNSENFNPRYKDSTSLPTGDKLIERIVTYKTKSTAYLIAISCWSYAKLEMPKGHKDTFFRFADAIVDILNNPTLENLRKDIKYLTERKNPLDLLIKQTDRFKKLGRETSTKQDIILDNVLLRLLFVLSYDNDIIQQIDITLIDIWLKEIYDFIKSYCYYFLPQYYDIQLSIRLSNTTVNSSSLYNQLNTKLSKLNDRIIEKITNNNQVTHKNIGKIIYKCQNNELTYLKTSLQHLQHCLISSEIVDLYKPCSIDYFMVNITQIAAFEFDDIKNDKQLISERKEIIHRYVKFIIGDILMSSSEFVHYNLESSNYIKRIVWLLLEKSHFYNTSLQKYLHNNAKIITFNYDNSLQNHIFNIFPPDIAYNFATNNITHVYGQLFLKDTDDNGINMCTQLWSALFCNKDNNYEVPVVERFEYNRMNNPNYGKRKISDLFQQIENSIKWIGEEKLDKLTEERSVMQKQIKDSDEIYFLGFGFDTNNLYQLGIIDKMENLESELKDKKTKTKLLISGGNAKIVNRLKKIFNISEISIIDSVWYLQDEKWEIQISSKFLPDALMYDL